MKKWLTLSLAMVAAAVSQAVTVAWTVPNSNKAWATTSDNKLSYNAYFVYSSSEMSTTEAHSTVTSAITNNTIGNGSVSYGWTMDETVTNSAGETLQTMFGTGLGPIPSTSSAGTGTSINADSAFYYLVVVSKTNPEDYAVAGTASGVTIKNSEITQNEDKVGGIYMTTAGTEPEAGAYFDIGGWLGGTWAATGAVPEPTIMALLALGVAGVALRRKQNFTK